MTKFIAGANVMLSREAVAELIAIDSLKAEYSVQVVLMTGTVLDCGNETVRVRWSDGAEVNHPVRDVIAAEG